MKTVLSVKLVLAGLVMVTLVSTAGHSHPR